LDVGSSAFFTPPLPSSPFADEDRKHPPLVCVLLASDDAASADAISASSTTAADMFDSAVGTATSRHIACAGADKTDADAPPVVPGWLAALHTPLPSPTAASVLQLLATPSAMLLSFVGSASFH